MVEASTRGTIRALRFKELDRRNVPKHIGDNEESDVAAANVNLIEMRDTAITGGDSNILELDIHIVLDWKEMSALSCSR